jgi:hypothetical protein
MGEQESDEVKAAGEAEKDHQEQKESIAFVEKAIEVYSLSPDESAALRKSFLSRSLVRFVPD